MSDGFVDDLLAAGIVAQSLDQALATLARVVDLASAAATSAEDAAAVQAAIEAALDAVGVDHRWTGTQLQIRLRDGSYGTAVDLKGAAGDAGPVPVIRVGTVAEGPFGVSLHVTDPANPIIDFVLPRGLAAWTPVIAGVTDGARRVLQIVDWTGGQGTKPATGGYIGASGFVSDLASATDVRGLPGGIAQNGSVTATHLARFTSANLIEDAGATLSTFGQGLIAAASAAAVKALLSLAAADVSGAEAVANKGTANGYAGLDGSAKVPLAQLPASVVGALNYQGIWNASINSPPLASGVGTKGALYKVATAGTTSIDGIAQWNVGDAIVFDGLVWDKIDGIANEVIRVAGLFGDINATALKAALAIAVTDVSGAAASARQIAAGAGLTGGGDLAADRTLSIPNNGVTNAMLAQAASLTLKANLGGATGNVSDVTLSAALDAILSSTRGAVLFRGATAWSALAPGAAGQALLTQGSGADPTWGTSSFPIVAVTPKSAAYTILATDKGQMFDLTGSVALTLPLASTASAGNPMWFHIRKRDGSASGVSAGSVIRAGSDTIEGSLTSIAVYQEQFTIFSFGSGWFLEKRQRGWISIGTTTIATSVASLLLSIGLADTELSQHQIDFWNVTKVSTSNLILRVSKAGTVDTGNNYLPAGVSGDGTTNVRAIKNATSSFQLDGGAGSPSTGKQAGQILVRNPTSTTVTNQTVRVDASVLDGTGLYAKLEGYDSTAGAIDGLQFSASVNLTAGTFTQQAYRP